MTSTRRPLVVLAFVLAAGAVVWARGDIRITPVPSDGRVLVSFTARDSWTLGVRELLQGAQQVTFAYEIELRRPAPFWFFDTALARARVNTVAKFDTLSAKYKVTRFRDGRTEQSDRLDQETNVRDWLTAVDHVELDPVAPLEPNVEYYVHVDLTISPRRSVSVWSLLPFSRGENAGRQPFTFIK